MEQKYRLNYESSHLLITSGRKATMNDVLRDISHHPLTHTHTYIYTAVFDILNGKNTALIIYLIKSYHDVMYEKFFFKE